jgi:diguanylate cyclase
MNEALRLISVQYELVFSLSESPELKKMLRQFLRVCNSRLNLVSSHIFLFHDQNNNPSPLGEDCQKESIKHYTSLPNQKNGLPFSEDIELFNKVKEFIEQKKEYSEENDEDTNHYFILIENHGVLTIECRDKLVSTLKGKLTPVFNRLSLSCSAAINRENLLREISAREIAEEKICFQANHDELTGLYNRRYITQKIKDFIITSKTIDQYGAVVFISINDFKSINDLMGHHIGDKVLIEIAKRLNDLIPDHYPIARFGGDEFIILLRHLDQEDIDHEVSSIIEKVFTEVKKPFHLNNNSYSLSFSAGYDTFSQKTISATQLIKNADLAMYEAKRSKLDYCLKYDIDMSDRLDKKINYEMELKRAITNNEFELHYQPQYDSTGIIIGAEALLRWNNPNRGYESPAIYIPIAEESDLIIQISEWVLNQACNDIRELEKTSLPDTFKKTSINISAKHIAKPDFVDTILTAIKKYGIQPQHFAIEITEGIMMGNIDSAINFLNVLKNHHIHCSIDDFGTGYSSLSYLKRLPASVVKIDRAFVKDMDSDKDNYSIAKMIIDLGRNLDMDIIAEGVETQAELNCLIALGCYHYQGFFFCKPVPFNQLVELILKAPLNQPKTNLQRNNTL